MTIEQSHGKARPTLVRSSDLRPPTAHTAPKPSDGRGPDGRFAPGNRIATGSGFRRTVKKLLGPMASPEEKLVRKDAWRVFVSTMRDMPSDAAPVRTLVALHARHVALAGYYTALAAATGLGTDDGRKLQDAADKQSQRAERTLVSAQDMARACADRESKRPIDPAQWERLLAEAAKPRRSE